MNVHKEVGSFQCIWFLIYSRFMCEYCCFKWNILEISTKLRIWKNENYCFGVFEKNIDHIRLSEKTAKK